MTSLMTATRQVASSRSFASDSDYAKMQTNLKELVSSYVTGTMIYSDGGLSLRESRSP